MAEHRTRPPHAGTASQERPLLFASQNFLPGEVDALANDNCKNKVLHWVYNGCCHTVHIQSSCALKGCLGVHMYHSALAFQKAPLPQCLANSKPFPIPTIQRKHLSKILISSLAYWEHPKERTAWQLHPCQHQLLHLVQILISNFCVSSPPGL